MNTVRPETGDQVIERVRARYYISTPENPGREKEFWDDLAYLYGIEDYPTAILEKIREMVYDRSGRSVNSIYQYGELAELVALARTAE